METVVGKDTTLNGKVQPQTGFLCDPFPIEFAEVCDLDVDDKKMDF